MHKLSNMYANKYKINKIALSNINKTLNEWIYGKCTSQSNLFQKLFWMDVCEHIIIATRRFFIFWDKLQVAKIFCE